MIQPTGGQPNRGGKDGMVRSEHSDHGGSQGSLSEMLKLMHKSTLGPCLPPQLHLPVLLVCRDTPVPLCMSPAKTHADPASPSMLFDPSVSLLTMFLAMSLFIFYLKHFHSFFKIQQINPLLSEAFLNPFIWVRFPCKFPPAILIQLISG